MCLRHNLLLSIQRMWKLMFINLEAKDLLQEFCCWCRWTLRQSWHKCILEEAQLVFTIIQYKFVITLFSYFKNTIFLALWFYLFWWKRGNLTIGCCLSQPHHEMSRSIFMILDANVQQSTKILGDLLKCTANDKFATHAKRWSWNV